ncbi:MAG TPA: type VI secretion system tube protein Hcp [Candidatus Sulfobium mesophilum]|nr:type VI secretion system tube protein Hcp [Candidatus Sulfobium mesophilum]
MHKKKFSPTCNDDRYTKTAQALFMGFLVVTLIVSLAAAVSDAAAADVKIYLRMAGVEGKSMDADHKNWIDVAEFGLMIELSKKESRSCQVHVVKYIDPASPVLWAAVTSAKVFTEVKVDMVRGVEPQVKLVEQTMTNVRVGRVEFGQMVKGQPAETITLLPEKVNVRYFIMNPDGTVPGTIDGMVNCLL